MRVVLDPNVVMSGLLSPHGSPSRVLLAWKAGHFELIVSGLLLAELSRALAYPKLRRRIPPDRADRAVSWLAQDATVRPDPSGPPTVPSIDPGDDYLISLAMAERALLVSGDDHLLRLRAVIPVVSAAGLLDRLGDPDRPRR